MTEMMEKVRSSEFILQAIAEGLRAQPEDVREQLEDAVAHGSWYLRKDGPGRYTVVVRGVDLVEITAARSDSGAN